MKKVLLTVIAALTMCGSIFAQYESHWPDFYYGPYEDQGGLVAAIAINGQIINVTDANWDALEVAAFVGEDECRANEMYLYDGYVIEYGDPFPILDGLAIFYTDPGDEVYFKMYDHMNEVLYETCEVTLLGEPFTVITGDDNFQGWDDPENPIILNFIISEPEEYTWNVPEEGWDVPADSANVEIPANSIVYIPDSCIAIANQITLGEGSSLVIVEGGQLYHNDNVEVTLELNVEGYGDEAKDGPAGYRLIASPVYTNTRTQTRPINGTRLNVGNFDLYKFDESTPGEEWFNYKGEGYVYENDDPVQFSDLMVTEGYLYANDTNNRIIFAGHTLPTSQEVFVGPLSYTAEGGSHYKGFNLIGNPYTCKALVSGVNEFYVMNDNGDGFDAITNAAEYQINPLQGILVEATAADQSVTFNAVAVGTAETGGPSGGDEFKLNLRVNGNNGDYDNAYVRFGQQGHGLKKLMLNENHTKLYFPVEDVDYAVVYAEEMGVMPVNFKAQNNGAYTINFTSTGRFNYLHLIDNMNGNDVDLLANSSYSFEATTSDYASRFKLVFATGNNSTEDNFAFFSNGNFIINNDGKATLQVVDLMGRIVKSESINGSASVNVNAAAGVYMLRLVNGDNVKVQKGVIK